MRLILDTHALVWSFDSDLGVLSETAKKAIATADALFVSAVSFYEIAQKIRLGKLALRAVPLDDLPEKVQKLGISILPATHDLLIVAASITWDHRDPFDRIIVAAKKLTPADAIVTKDRKITAFDPEGVIWR